MLYEDLWCNSGAQDTASAKAQASQVPVNAGCC